MEKTINGKVYELVPQTEEENKNTNPCFGCAFNGDGILCEEAGDVCLSNETPVWKLKQEDKK